MLKRKLAFADPQTGEKITSTWLARGMARLAGGLLFGLLGGLGGGVFLGWKEGGPVWTFAWPIAGAALGLAYGMIYGRGNPLVRQVHRGIARQQHRLFHRSMRRREYPHVSDRALSRARPGPGPQAGFTALSRAPSPEKPRTGSPRPHSDGY